MAAVSNVEQLQEIMMQFYASGDKNDIDELFKTVPYMSSGQKRIYSLLRMYQVKYGLEKVDLVLNYLVQVEKENRTSLMFKKNLEALSLSKHFKGMKLNGSVGDE